MLNFKVSLAATLKICFLEWECPELLGTQIVQILKGVFHNWLNACPVELLLPDEIVVVQNISAILNKAQQQLDISKEEKLNSSHIWLFFSQPYNLTNSIQFFNKCIIESYSSESLFVVGSALKTQLIHLSKDEIECLVISLLDLAICTPVNEIDRLNSILVE